MAPNGVGMSRPAGILGMTQVLYRSGQVGRFPFPRWVEYLLINRRELCYRCPRRRRAGTLHLVVRIAAGGVASDATNRVTMSQSARFSPRI